MTSSKATIYCFHSSSDLYGASRIFLQTVKLLKENGFNPIVYLSEEGTLSDELRSAGVAVEIFRLGVIRRKYFTFFGLFNRVYFLSKAIIHFYRLFKAKKGLIYNNASSILAPLVAGRLAGTKHLWHIHEIISTPAFFARFISYCMDRLSTINIVVSNATIEHWIKLRPSLGRPGKMKMIHNGIPAKKFQKESSFDRKKYLKDLGIEASDRDLVVGMIGRVHFWKGQNYFIEIASQLKKSHQNAIFLIAGDPFPGYEYLLDDISETIKALGMVGQVHMMGYVKHPERFFQTLDLFILPSILPDPLPTVVLEAMLCELPVVATAHGGALDMIIDQGTGVFIPWDNSLDAAQMILPLLSDDIKRKQMGKNGRQRVLEHFSQESYERSILELVQNI